MQEDFCVLGMGDCKSENKVATNNETTNEFTNKFLTSIQNVQNTINETVNKSTSNVTQNIKNESNGSNFVTTINKIDIDGDFELDNTSCPNNGPAFNFNTDNELKSSLSVIQQGYLDGKMVDKVKQEIKNNTKSSTELEDKIKNDLNNALEALTKAEREPGFGDAMKSLTGSKTTTESNNTIVNKIKSNIEKYVSNINNTTNKLENITENTIKQVSDSSCQMHNKTLTDNSFMVKKNVKIKCGTVLENRNKVVSDLYANCYQTGQISQEFIKDLGIDSQALNENITKNKNDSTNTAKNDSKATTDSKEKDALAETAKAGMNNLADVTKTGISAYTNVLIAGAIIVCLIIIGIAVAMVMTSGNGKTTAESINSSTSSIVESATAAKGLFNTVKTVGKMFKKGGGTNVINSIINFMNENKWLLIMLFILLSINSKENNNIEPNIHYIRTPKFNIQLVK